MVRTPASTYRLQVTPQLNLHAAAGLLGYLHDLGVDWVYLSPLLQAEPGSDHGYDVVAHDRVDAARGGPAGLTALSTRARELGMGVLVDVVPNHVGVATPRENAWWWELLRLGRAASHADAFDVDWEAGDGRILIPVVGDDDRSADGRVGHLRVVDGELRYHDHAFPLAPGSTDDEAADIPDADRVHARQHYRLVSWRDADSRLNYRRFFAVNTLAGVRVEEPDTLADTHVEIRRWFRDGLVDGLRVDHPDGLRDPRGYLADLQRLTGGAYVLVEKILEPGEELPTSWDTHGTTGYDVLGQIDRVLTDPAGARPLTALESRLRGQRLDWAELVHDTKRSVADGILGSEVARIVREVRAVAPGPPPGPTDDRRLRDAVAELLACFPVYRSYLPEGREHLDQAFGRARDRRPELTDVYDLLEPLLGNPTVDAALRFQQTSGMVMAKGVEDCAFYRTDRLTSLNEVGGDPADFSLSPADFHAAMEQRQQQWPQAMTTTSSHDTKRGEDVRARIAVLAELPGWWTMTLDRLLDLAPLPDPGFADLLWQAALGAWPAWPDQATRDYRHRLHGYAEKAMREAGDRTTWTAPDPTYEATVHRVVDAAFDDPRVHEVLTSAVQRLAGPGRSNALAAKALALTVPGVPDLYQGSELWEQSLVDPDNRRPVDFDLRRHLLDQTRQNHTALPPPGDERRNPAGDPLAKLRLVNVALTLRRDRPELFTDYHPVVAQGSAAKHALAFDRGGAVTVLTRLPVGLAAAGGWGDTVLALPEGDWVDRLTGSPWSGEVPLGRLLAASPVALLVREQAAP